jgi:hypothetical protein
MEFTAAPKAVAVGEFVDPVPRDSDDAMLITANEIWSAVQEGTQPRCLGGTEGEGIENLTIPLPKSRPIDIRAIRQNPFQFP